MIQKESGPKAAQQLVVANELYNKSQSRREQIDRIKDSANYVRFYASETPGDETEADADGWITGGTCPFTDDCQAGEFEVNLQTGRCRCKGCESGTDALGYLMLRHGLRFPDALRYLRDMG